MLLRDICLNCSNVKEVEKWKGRRMKKGQTKRREGEGMLETGGKRINVRKG
jgi:hypothetical protein